jgi:hypothetical protein
VECYDLAAATGPDFIVHVQGPWTWGRRDVFIPLTEFSNSEIADLNS